MFIDDASIKRWYTLFLALFAWYICSILNDLKLLIAQWKWQMQMIFQLDTKESYNRMERMRSSKLILLWNAVNCMNDWWYFCCYCCCCCSFELDCMQRVTATDERLIHIAHTLFDLNTVCRLFMAVDCYYGSLLFTFLWLSVLLLCSFDTTW